MLARICAFSNTIPLKSSPVTDSSIYDVIICGGGLVGSALAAALSANRWTQGFRLLVLDRQVVELLQAPPQENASLPDIPGLRVSTITPRSVQLLQEIGAWQDVAPPRSAAFNTMQVWDGGGNGFVQYRASDVNMDSIGYVAENLVLHTAFVRQICTLGRPPVFHRPANLEKLTLPSYTRPEAGEGAQLAEITLQGGEVLRARLVVGADGARSQVRQMAQLRVASHAYQQQGLVATVRTEGPNSTAQQRFLATGPLALLPVRAGFSNVVWSTSPQQAHYLKTLDPASFGQAVHKALTEGTMPSSSSFGAATGFEPPPRVLESVGASPQSFPLHLIHSGRYVRPRLALIGDAAHSVHPLAGQGVNLGFGDVVALTETLQHAVECGRDIGELALLEESYERPRQRSNLAMMAVLDGLQKVYRPQRGVIASARRLGVDFINTSAVAKQQIMKFAMGL